MMALKKLAHFKSQLQIASLPDKYSSLQLESKLAEGLPSLSICKKTLKGCRSRGEQWASQDWAFLIMVLDLHEALCQAQGNAKIVRIAQKITPFRLKVYYQMPEKLFVETEKIATIIDEDVVFF
jgi:hypothetical protein